MVYLIDDKKSRQESDYLWTTERFVQFKNTIRCIYTLQELENESKEVFSNDNIILYHESFIDQTNKSSEAIDKRTKLSSWSENKGNIIVYFSGSKNAREVIDNIAHIPVSTVYANLEIFLRKILINDTNLNYLMFGENISLEEELNSKQDVSLNETFKENPTKLQGKTLFLRPSRKYISVPFYQFDEKILFADVSDEKLTIKINAWLNDKIYDYIFLPLCFGNILCDYNGLRLATHIRCTSSLNQLSSIFIYGFVGIEYLIQNEYFNILKTKNILLLPFSKNAFRDVESILPFPITNEELPEQISKLKLDVPKNYEDSHSIANEWAIYRWAESLNANDKETGIISKYVSTGLYFKYLKTIYPRSAFSTLTNTELEIICVGSPRILYIDDEANKGWYQIFHKILCDINGMSFAYLDDEFNTKNQDEIIKISLDKIIYDHIDIVILDFRLHPVDFTLKHIENITGFKILKEIKKQNPGIQVIVFTATNKIWNLQAMQEAGLDGFILKESPENSQDPSFTLRLIEDFISCLKSAISRTYLKKIEELKHDIVKTFQKNPLPRYYPNDLRCLKGLQYQNLLLSELESICNILNTNNVNRFNHAMLMQFKIVECLIEIFIPEKGKKSKWLFYDNSEVKYFYMEDNKLYEPNEELVFYDRIANRRMKMKIPQHEYNSTRNKIDCFIEQKLRIDEKLILHKKLKELVNYRNRFIHPTDRLSLKPLNSDTIVDWMSIINRIISKI